MRLKSILLIGCLALAAGSASAQSGWSIGLAWDAAGTVCNLEAVTGNLYGLCILAYLPCNESGCGITGAEVRVDGFPAEWPIVSTIPSPGSNLSIGDPLGAGCNIAFPNCKMQTVTLLYTIQFVAQSPVGSRVLTVLRHTTPSNPNLACPQLGGYPRGAAERLRDAGVVDRADDEHHAVRAITV